MKKKQRKNSFTDFAYSENSPGSIWIRGFFVYALPDNARDHVPGSPGSGCRSPPVATALLMPEPAGLFILFRLPAAGAASSELFKTGMVKKS